MRTIMVEPERLNNVASNIENSNNEYDQLYQAMYSEVERMQSSWQGKDNVAFVSQINSFKEDLRQISIIMRQYVEFLRNSARAYQEMQDEITAQANSLRV